MELLYTEEKARPLLFSNSKSVLGIPCLYYANEKRIYSQEKPELCFPEEISCCEKFVKRTQQLQIEGMCSSTYLRLFCCV